MNHIDNLLENLESDEQRESMLAALDKLREAGFMVLSPAAYNAAMQLAVVTTVEKLGYTVANMNGLDFQIAAGREASPPN